MSDPEYLLKPSKAFNHKSTEQFELSLKLQEFCRFLQRTSCSYCSTPQLASFVVSIAMIKVSCLSEQVPIKWHLLYEKLRFLALILEVNHCDFIHGLFGFSSRLCCDGYAWSLYSFAKIFVLKIIDLCRESPGKMNSKQHFHHQLSCCVIFFLLAVQFYRVRSHCLNSICCFSYSCILLKLYY